MPKSGHPAVTPPPDSGRIPQNVATVISATSLRQKTQTNPRFPQFTSCAQSAYEVAQFTSSERSSYEVAQFTSCERSSYEVAQFTPA